MDNKATMVNQECIYVFVCIYVHEVPIYIYFSFTCSHMYVGVIYPFFREKKKICTDIQSFRLHQRMYPTHICLLCIICACSCVFTYFSDTYEALSCNKYVAYTANVTKQAYTVISASR